MPLEELIEIKVREIRGAAENDFWGLFREHPDDISGMSLEYVTMGALLGRNLLVQERERFNTAREIVARMRALCTQARAAQSEAELEEIVW